MAIKNPIELLKEYPNAPWNALWAAGIVGVAYAAMEWWSNLPMWQMIVIAICVIFLFIVFTVFIGYMKKYYGLDVLAWLKDMAALLKGEATSVAQEEAVVTPSETYPAWPGVSYIVYQGAVAAFMDIATYKGQEVEGYPTGKRFIPIITKYGEEMQGRFCPDDGIIYKVGKDSVFDDERAEDAKAYAVLKSKVIDTFNRLCPVTFNGNRYMSATGGEYDQLILPYVKSLNLTEQQFVDMYAAIPPVPPSGTKFMLKNGGQISAVGALTAHGDRVVYYLKDGAAQMTGYLSLCDDDKATVANWLRANGGT